MPMSRIDPETAPAAVRPLLRLTDGDVRAALERIREAQQYRLDNPLPEPHQARWMATYAAAAAMLEELLAR